MPGIRPFPKPALQTGRIFATIRAAEASVMNATPAAISHGSHNAMPTAATEPGLRDHDRPPAMRTEDNPSSCAVADFSAFVVLGPGI